MVSSWQRFREYRRFRALTWIGGEITGVSQVYLPPKYSQSIFHWKIQVSQYGNALVATAFIQGIVAEELKKDELDYYDEDYPVSICVKASKN